MMMVMPMATGRGMGLYPGDPCYDKARDDPNSPWPIRWLPYWADRQSEADCQQRLLAGPTPQAPATERQMSGQDPWTPDMSSPNYEQWALSAAAGMSEDPWGAAYSATSAAAKEAAKVAVPMTGLILLGAGIVAYLYFFGRRR